MEILGDRHFVEIPGDKLHQLPPLLIRAGAEAARMSRTIEMASTLIESEEMLAQIPMEPLDQERRKMDLAIQLVEQYLGLIEHWRLGDSILDWIRQCEMTFEMRQDLRPLLRPDVWPHAGRSSFVMLLRDKAVDTHGIAPENAVGTRLAFRQPPPLNCFSDQFLLYLKATLASTAYSTWSNLSPDPTSAFPPERFSFEVHAI
ncbi:hypothetical protein [uncultured Paludibaculum sp.]|uniref:hypothetical protein n=1 Tax=uncultured Paludibaculum sp. TaxID=1765020 RepID=UPI002AAA7BD9|nr:hypothetical protein [uncultured Paludibaculum sp.]